MKIEDYKIYIKGRRKPLDIKEIKESINGIDYTLLTLGIEIKRKNKIFYAKRVKLG